MAVVVVADGAQRLPLPRLNVVTVLRTSRRSAFKGPIVAVRANGGTTSAAACNGATQRAAALPKLPRAQATRVIKPAFMPSTR